MVCFFSRLTIDDYTYNYILQKKTTTTTLELSPCQARDDQALKTHLRNP